MFHDPDCNRVDLDDEGDPEELNFDDDVNTFSDIYGGYDDEGEDDE